MEKRVSKRKKVRRPARIYWPDLQPICACTVSDLSDTGARLKLSPGEDSLDNIPSEFVLSFTPDQDPRNKRRSVTRKCRVVWMRDDQLGARFPGRQRFY
ncbi:MAG: PilZ domain-containing protein [Rhizobiales bacterium]|nr:PilZ domain-containing protein [Hyphomicrobiales bacterium]